MVSARPAHLPARQALRHPRCETQLPRLPCRRGVCVAVPGGADPQRHRGAAPGAVGTVPRERPPQAQTRAAPVMFLLLHVLFSRLPLPLFSLPLPLSLLPIPLLFLSVLFLLPVASSRPRGRSCGILRPGGSPPRSPWELSWRPAGSGGPCRYTQPRAEGGGRGQSQQRGAGPRCPALPCSRLGRGAGPRGRAALSPRRGWHGLQARLALLPGAAGLRRAQRAVRDGRSAGSGRSGSACPSSAGQCGLVPRGDVPVPP